MNRIARFLAVDKLPNIPTGGLARAFWGGLFESEARHHTTYVRLAKEFQGEAEVVARLKELAAAEAAIMREGESQPRMHS
jgi:tRNA-(ms[2]io[6]A)-hydroxylase